ncbi:MAG: hypothetical protein LBH25_00805 [Fibromonadaceae bacterium]|nr:hypothetical protein [Fibromonadaceae bacterium]
MKEEVGDEALFYACKEGGVCFGDLAGKANADYGAWCMVNKYGGKLVLSFQLYDVGEKDILYTKGYDAYSPKNADDMIAIIMKEVPDAFRKITGTTSEKASSSSVAKASSYSATPTANTIKDSRDGKTYKAVKIGTQTWAAENLNYNASGSYCYENDPANCGKYGRLYDWNTAMKACPSGWHLPSGTEWDKLYRYADGTSGVESPYESETAGKYLKAKSGWNDYEGKSGNGTDGFSGNKSTLFSVRCVKD